MTGYGQAAGPRQKYAGMEAGDSAGVSRTLWREYDSVSGRWGAPDPYGGSMESASPQTFNRYSYVNNDPVNKVDPAGLMLSDIGVVQSGDAEFAHTLQGASDAAWMREMNRQYAGEHGLKVATEQVAGGTRYSVATRQQQQNGAFVAGMAASGASFTTGFFGGGAAGTDPTTSQGSVTRGELIYKEENDARGGSHLSPCGTYIFSKLGFGSKIDLGRVRIHLGIPGWIEEGAKRFGSIIPGAVTVGYDIYWRVDDTHQYVPNTVDGLSLTGHELSHVYQWKVFGDAFMLRYLKEWANNGFKYGGRMEDNAKRVEDALRIRIVQQFGNDPCKPFRNQVLQ